MPKFVHRLLCALVLAASLTPAAGAADFPLISAHVPLSTANYYAFDLVVHSASHDPTQAKAANPRALWFMLGMGGGTYGSEVSDQAGFDKARCMLRHANGSGWSGVQPFNMTLPDCDDAIADRVAAGARAAGLYTKPWDGIYQDSFSYHPYQYAVRTGGGLTDIDADLDGRPDTTVALEAAWRVGMRRFAARLRADLPGKLVLANGPDWGNTTDLDGVDGDMIEHAVDDITYDRNGWTIQSLKDTADRWYAVSNGRTRLVTTISYWKLGVAPPADARQQMESSADAQQRMRFGLTASLMAGIYYDFQYSNQQGSGAVFDEYRGGDLDKQGYLGAPLGPGRPLGGGLWRRDFEKGVAFANESTAPRDADVSGEGLRRLRGTENPTVNSGAAAGVVTLAGKDGIILLRAAGSPPSPPPPSPPTTGPTVSFVGVAAGATLRGTVDWEAAVAGGVTPTQVVFSVDGAAVWTERAAPYQLNADGRFDTMKLADGPHTLGLAATLADGRVVTATAQVQVANAPTPPAAGVAFAGVSSGATLRGTVTWEATITGPVPTQVVFTVDGTTAWTERAAPFQVNADGRFDTTKLIDGPHTLGLAATLPDGRVVTATAQVQIANLLPASPVVTQVGVTAGATLKGTVGWEATVSGGAVPTQVVFSVDGAVVWTERAAPFQFNADGRFDSTKLADGPHTLAVAATLPDGKVLSASAAVSVANR